MQMSSLHPNIFEIWLLNFKVLGYRKGYSIYACKDSNKFNMIANT
jgi:hypothetical protein